MSEFRHSPCPAQTLSVSLGEALKERRSGREFSPASITEDKLLALLWACGGVNRADGHRTIPSAMNAQEISVCVLREDGVFRYNAAEHALEKISQTDARAASTGGQDFVTVAPVTLAFVADKAAFTAATKAPYEGNKNPLIDAGIAVGAAVAAASALKLSAVCRTWFDEATLSRAMGLPDGLVPVVCVTVGEAA